MRFLNSVRLLHANGTLLKSINSRQPVCTTSPPLFSSRKATHGSRSLPAFLYNNLQFMEGFLLPTITPNAGFFSEIPPHRRIPPGLLCPKLHLRKDFLKIRHQLLDKGNIPDSSRKSRLHPLLQINIFLKCHP